MPAAPSVTVFLMQEYTENNPLFNPMASDRGLSERSFEKVTRFIYETCGIQITPLKRTMVEGRIRKRMRALGIEDLDDYCDYIFSQSDDDAAEEITHFIDSITTNKTDFFREKRHFEYLKESILPEFSESGRPKLWCWSAASSMGAEAYTMAMVIEEYCRVHRKIDYTILASDLSTAMLSMAVNGRYPAMMLDPVSEDMRKRYIMVARHPEQDEFRIKPNLRSKINFFQLNLMNDRYPLTQKMDVIFCRNVLIYFDKQTQKRVLLRLCENLRSGGYLILGHSETANGIDLPLDSIGSAIFRRR